ncbi:MAG: hypothetical protein EWM47_00110 [Anaerolineaceae bacterium]|nr:MAG: hypothetical protein EWM47_00110 [Anaerolineaceae bacterium]
MSKNFRSIYKDIINNRNLEDRIPEFLRMAVEKYDTFSTVRLALNYYTFYEIYCDEKEHWASKLHEHINKINSIIADAAFQVRSDEEADKYIKQTDEIRTSVTRGMETLTLFVDLFEIYEYALNRVEYRFKDMDQLEDDEEIAKEVLRYIFDSEENTVINDRIREIIGQLPIRITKHKYFDYISDSFHELVGANEDILATYIYIIRSCAMLDLSQDLKDAYPLLWEKKERLEQLNFKDITKEEYEAAILLVQEAVVLLEKESTAYYVLIELVNELYTMLLCNPYREVELAADNKHREAALHIIRSISSAFSKDKQEEATSELLSSFGVIEGLQEDMEYDILSLEDVLYHLDKHHREVVESLGKEKLLNTLLNCKDLHSGSLFVELNNSGSDKIVDRERISKEIKVLIKELEDKFQSSDRMIIRAIMANTMDKMPVFFESHTEVMEYVLYSLNKCTDLAEKYASLEIIESIME